MLAALAVAASLTAAGSANVGIVLVVSSTADAVDAAPGNGVCATSSGACTLRAAVMESNALPGDDTISLSPGTYEIAITGLNQNLETVGDFDITDGVTIAGNTGAAGSTIVDGGTPLPGAPVQAHGRDRLFEISADGEAVVFSDLTLREGWAAEYGGAIMNASTASVTVLRSTITRSGAGKSGGGIESHVDGSLTILDSTLTDNYAGESGSAVNNNRGGTLTIDGSTVSSNSAADAGLDENLLGAGAIANNAELDAVGTMTVTDSLIADNRAGGGRNGAGISNDGAGTVAITDVRFERNAAAGGGGALFNANGLVTVMRGTFTENRGKDGGAVSSAGAGLIEILDSTFTKNVADDWGGGLHNGNTGSATVVASTFTENSALNGGGLGNEGSGLVSVDASTFTKNLALDTATAVGGEGGGMHSNSGGEVVITGGSFTENRALAGGGFSNEGGGVVVMTGTRVASNYALEAGGGILVQSGAVRMVGIDVVGNLSDSPLEGGGGISYAGDKAVSLGESAAIEGSLIRNNVSKGDGGGIDSRGDGPLVITTTAITGNTALIGGAIHHVGDATLDLTRSTLSGNVAENGGGVFSDGDGEATIENSTLSANRAAQFGGGVLVSSRVVVRHSTVVGNLAAQGGGINNGGGDLIGDGLVFLASSIVASSPTGGNCAGTITSRGGNVENTNTCQLTLLSDQPGTSPLLGPLASNGGPTQTHALLAGSPAQDRAECTELDPCPPVDQRGVARPTFAAADAGAYESELVPGGGGTPICPGLTERPVPADYDTWIAQGSPNSNSGADSILDVSQNERALVHFTLPSIPPGCELVGATLRLYAASATEGRTLEALHVAAPWTEFAATWNNQPATAGGAASTASGLGVLEWDVQEQALAMYAQGSQGSHGFLVRDAGGAGGGQQAFHSREKGTNEPELVLVFDDPDAPPEVPPGDCPTNAQLVYADRDSWVSQSSPTNNFGTDSTLKVKSQTGSNSRALVRFPLPAVPDGCTTIAAATLRMHVSSAKDGRTLEALRLGATWTESGVNWGNQPPAIGAPASVPAVAGTIEWDVADQLLGMYGSGNHGFLIRDGAENGVGDEQTLHSREKTTDDPPVLVVSFDASTPGTTLGQRPASPTTDTAATFTFSSDRADATFECSLDGAAFAACASPLALTGLAEGGHLLEVRATRRIRAVDPTPASHAWTIAIPPESNVSGPSSPSASAGASLTFGADDPDATFECSLDGAPFAGCSSPVELAALLDGEHTFQVRGTDVLGNVEPTPAAHTWLVAVPPETAIESGPPALTRIAAATLEFGGSDNGPPSELDFECSLDGAVFAPCTSPAELGELADGEHTFAVRAVDPAGNVDATPAARTWTVDTTPPETTIDDAPATPTNAAAATFAFSSDEDGSTFACSLDGAPLEACSSGVSYEALEDGEHLLTVVATDPAGNADPDGDSHAWRVDTVAPETTILSGPASPTNATSAAFSFSASEDASFECALDAASFSACADGVAYADLGETEHTLRVRATDAAGNTGAPDLHAWTVDTTPPETTITSSPPAHTNDTTPSFTLEASEAGSTFECSLDAATWASCDADYTTALLADGPYTVSVRATDPAGNTDLSPATYDFTVDTDAPETTIDAGPPPFTNDPTPSFTLSADEAGSSFECSFDGVEWTECPAAYETSALADGFSTLSVRATDLAGNTDATPTIWSFTVDTVAPETTVDSSPAVLTQATSASFGFSADEDATFECSFGDEPFFECASGKGYEALADGEYMFRVRATDAAGNVDGSAASFAWTVDTTPPQTTIAFGPPAHTNDTTPGFTLAASEDVSTFECSLDDGTTWAGCAASHTTDPLGDGAYTLRVRATDPAGNTDASAASRSFTVDTVAPETTIETGPPGFTNDSTPSFTLAASQAGSTFECSLDGLSWASCDADHTAALLADGAYTLSVRATDMAGNRDESPAMRDFTVDTIVPQTTIDSGPAALTQATTAAFAYIASETATFACSLDGSAFGACPASYSGLVDGAHTFAVRATDQAGNTDATPASYTWTVDTTAPQTTIVSGPPALTNDTTPSFALEASEAESTIACSLDGTTWVACGASYAPGPLADGAYTLRARATDPAGNTGASAAGWSFTVDTDAPQTTIDAGPSGYVTTASATFAFSADEAASFECALDEEPFAPCGGTKAYEGLGEGAHTFSVRATDLAGNADATPGTRSFTVDTVAPETTIGSGPAALTNATSATFAFSSNEAGSTFACSLDGAAYGACPAAYSGLADGSHTFSVRATDLAGNTDSTPATRTWTVDTAAPETSLSTSLSDPGNDATPTFSFTATESSTFRCRIDGGPFATCTSPHTTAALAAGSHTFDVQAVDAAGNADSTPASRTFAIDLTAPETALSTTLSSPGRDTTPEFSFTASEAATFRCRVDAQPFAACTSPHTTAALAEGTHTFEVQATDAAGNADPTPASRAFTIDLTPPETTITTAPPAGTTSTLATFTFAASEVGSTFQCSLDGAALATCTSPVTHTVTLGAHTFTVRATDVAGNTDTSAATHSWTVEAVDTTAPETTITAGPTGATNDTTPTFSFTASETGSTFQCSLNGAAFTTCSSPLTTATLSNAAHTFAVRATDTAGNTDLTPAAAAFTVDTISPETSFTFGPSGPTGLAAASFGFTSTEAGSAFQCSLDAAAFTSCSSPVTTPPLGEGEHTFAVRATDAAGNTDASAAARTFTVDLTAPDTTITAAPAPTTSNTAASFSFTASEAGSGFQCSLDGAGFVSCSSPAGYTVAPGAHTFAVRATDGVGNTDQTPATHSWTVQSGDVTPPETTITAGPTGATTDSTPTWSFTASEAGSTFACSLDGAAYATCASPFTTAVLADGPHAFAVRAADPAGNTDSTPATRSITVDTTPPDTTITSGPSGPTNDSTPTFAFTSSETPSTFQCSVDTGAFTNCSSPFTASTLSSGAHTFRVRAVDGLAQVDATPTSRSITVDTSAPNTTINSGPPSSTATAVATFTFSSTDATATFECSLDTGGYAACVSPVSVTVAPGAHTFRVRARDAAGNVDATPATRNWTRTADTTPPNTTITSAPTSGTTSTSASFSFTSSETGSTFECSLDGAVLAACTSPAAYTVAPGSHTFQVRARDAAGNVDATPASHSWTVQSGDTTPPNTTITSAPPATTTDLLATFTFTASETGSSFECQLDSTGYIPCSSPISYAVAVGAHTFLVRAWDAAGNLDQTPASHSWTVQALDTTPPETTITSGPSSPTTSTAATFTFTSSEAGSSFECSLDGAAFAACVSPASYTVGIGPHALQVRALDGAGNLDQSPASYPWTVEAPPPGTCTSSTVTLGASADSWILQSSASSNYGTDSVLKVDSKSGGNARALVRFALPSVPAGCQVTNAQLRLYAGSYKTGRTLQALALTGAWTQSGVTWSNQPAASGTAATVPSAAGYLAWNVTTQLAATYALSTGFLVRDQTEDGAGLEQGFHSREKAPDNPPQLVVTFG